MVATLNKLGQGVHHVVTKVIKTEFVIGAVGDVGIVGGFTLFRCHVGQDHADFQTQEPVDAPHPFRVTLGQVIVDGDHMHALAFQGIQVGRQHTGQGFSFTGAHFGNTTEVECCTTHDLHKVVFLTQHSVRGFAGYCEGFVE